LWTHANLRTHTETGKPDVRPFRGRIPGFQSLRMLSGSGRQQLKKFNAVASGPKNISEGCDQVFMTPSTNVRPGQRLIESSCPEPVRVAKLFSAAAKYVCPESNLCVQTLIRLRNVCVQNLPSRICLSRICTGIGEKQFRKQGRWRENPVIGAALADPCSLEGCFVECWSLMAKGRARPENVDSTKPNRTASSRGASYAPAPRCLAGWPRGSLCPSLSLLSTSCQEYRLLLRVVHRG
jgi:hypothetical protein